MGLKILKCDKRTNKPKEGQTDVKSKIGYLDWILNSYTLNYQSR